MWGIHDLDHQICELSSDDHGELGMKSCRCESCVKRCSQLDTTSSQESGMDTMSSSSLVMMISSSSPGPPQISSTPIRGDANSIRSSKQINTRSEGKLTIFVIKLLFCQLGYHDCLNQIQSWDAKPYSTFLSIFFICVK